MCDMAISPATLATQLEPFRDRPRWWLALSGGLDSCALLHLLTVLRRDLPGPWPPLTALHVHHGLSPNADGWSGHCRRFCEGLGIDLVEERVVVVPTGEGVEAAARRARYAVFERLLGAGELLLLAQHRDDQAETVLLRLLRGGGVTGAAAMPPSRALGRGALLRPLLAVGRDELEAYAHSNGLDWIDDESNADERYDRNYLRHRVLPLLRRRWPAAPTLLARFAAQAAETNTLLDELAAADLATCRGSGDTLSVTACLALPPARRRHLLRQWLAGLGLPPPPRTRLQQIDAVLSAAADAEPLVCWPGAEVRRYRDALYAMAPLPPLPNPAVVCDWQPDGAGAPAGTGELLGVPGEGGLRADRRYQLRARRGGERCRPLGRAHSQSLKKLLQEAGVPPWWRDRLPLLWYGDELAAVADLWLCEGYRAIPGEAGWQLRWRLPVNPSD